MLHLSKQAAAWLRGDTEVPTGYTLACTDEEIDMSRHRPTALDIENGVYTILPAKGEDKMLTKGGVEFMRSGKLLACVPTCPKCAVLWDQALEKGKNVNS